MFRAVRFYFGKYLYLIQFYVVFSLKFITNCFELLTQATDTAKRSALAFFYI